MAVTWHEARGDAREPDGMKTPARRSSLTNGSSGSSGERSFGRHLSPIRPRPAQQAFVGMGDASMVAEGAECIRNTDANDPSTLPISPSCPPRTAMRDGMHEAPCRPACAPPCRGASSHSSGKWTSGIRAWRYASCLSRRFTGTVDRLARSSQLALRQARIFLMAASGMRSHASRMPSGHLKFQ